MRVPAVFSWPGRIAPDVVHDLGSTLDLMPTVLRAAGVVLPQGLALDGVNLLPRLTGSGENSPLRNTLAYYRAGELRAWRQGPWKLHIIVEGAYGVGPAKEVLDVPQLYHLGRDPGERFDLARTHPEVVAEIQAAISRHKEQLNSQPPLFDARLAEHVQ